MKIEVRTILDSSEGMTKASKAGPSSEAVEEGSREQTTTTFLVLQGPEFASREPLLGSVSFDFATQQL